MKKLHVILLLVACLAAFLVLNYGSEPTVEEPSVATLNRGLLSDPESIDPHKARSTQAAEVQRDIGEGLMTYSATAELVDRLVRGPAEGLAITKQSLNLELNADLEAALENEARAQAELMARPDFQEGFDAFMNRRAPRFKGGPE